MEGISAKKSAEKEQYLIDIRNKFGGGEGAKKANRSFLLFEFKILNCVVRTVAVYLPRI